VALPRWLGGRAHDPLLGTGGADVAAGRWVGTPPRSLSADVGRLVEASCSADAELPRLYLVVLPAARDNGATAALHKLSSGATACWTPCPHTAAVSSCTRHRTAS